MKGFSLHPSAFILTMQLWTTEYGTLWAWQPTKGLPPRCQPRIEVTLAEVGTKWPADEASHRDEIASVSDELAAAMNLASTEPIRQRLQGRRRCFYLRLAGQTEHERRPIVAYGWVTCGVECVGELERQFNLRQDEAYLWDFATLPAWRGQRLYSALLSHIIYRLHEENVTRIWIGASRQNQPSIQGFANAGFQHVVDVTYCRFYRLTWLWIHQALTLKRPLVAAAYRILINAHEQRFGRLAIGYKR